METGAVCAGKGIKMGKAIKDFLKRILPPPVHAFNREVERILKAVREEGGKLNAEKHLLQEIQKELEILRTEQALLFQHQKQEAELLRQMQQELQVIEKADAILQRLDTGIDSLEALKEQQNGIARQLAAVSSEQKEIAEKAQKAGDIAERSRREAANASRHASEAVWAEIFNNTIAGKTWLKDVSFSPGRWAVGYPYLYVMYRVLNEMRPKHILELGLGQSTRMIAQYAAAFDDVEHIVVEHDPEWIQFFCNSFQLPANSKIVPLELEMVPYKEAEAVRVYKGFEQAFSGQKFDFISVDAPLGSDMKLYSRIDILKIIPDALKDSFSILIDDYMRIGEQNLVDEIKLKLNTAKIDFCNGRYEGEKRICTITSNDLHFLCSL